MTTFLLIRHATNDLVGNTIAGWLPEVHLNEIGRRQADALAERLAPLELHALYASPLDRTLETARAIALRKGLEVRVCPEIGELRFGEWTGRTLEALEGQPDWRRFNTYRSGTRIPGGELAIELQARMVTALERIGLEHPGQRVALVSHGDPLKVVLTYYLGIPLDFLLRFDLAPASVSVLELSPDGPQVLCINHTGPLPLL